ncbi:MAG: DUF47 domain-containing protein [Candidatus Thorarchaeota archaeon]
MPGNPSSNIFLGFRAEEKVLKLAQEHAAAIAVILKTLQKAISSKLDGAKEESKKATEKIFNLESDADSLRRSMLRDLSKSTLEAADRESLVRLAKVLDRVADWANDSALLLAILPMADISSKFKALFIDFTTLLTGMGNKLQGAIEAIFENLEKAKQLCDSIEENEKQADRIYIQGLRHLLQLDSSHSAAEIVLFRDLLHNLENTADTTEDAVDQLRIIILRHS